MSEFEGGEFDELKKIEETEEEKQIKDVAKIINQLVNRVLIEETEKEAEEQWTDAEYRAALIKTAEDVIKEVSK